jgi:hypothetical protein
LPGLPFYEDTGLWNGTDVTLFGIPAYEDLCFKWFIYSDVSSVLSLWSVLVFQIRDIAGSNPYTMAAERKSNVLLDFTAPRGMPRRHPTSENSHFQFFVHESFNSINLGF